MSKQLEISVSVQDMIDFLNEIPDKTIPFGLLQKENLKPIDKAQVRYVELVDFKKAVLIDLDLGTR